MNCGNYTEPVDPWLGYRSNPYGHASVGSGDLRRLQLHRLLQPAWQSSGSIRHFRALVASLTAASASAAMASAALAAVESVDRGLNRRRIRRRSGSPGRWTRIGGGGFVRRQGQFSHPGGQMGMSFGFNRDFGPLGLAAAGPLPAWGSAMNWFAATSPIAPSGPPRSAPTRPARRARRSSCPTRSPTGRCQVTAVSREDARRHGEGQVRAREPIMVWPMLPRTFTEGDTVRVFGTVHNLTDKEQTVKVQLKAENGAGAVRCRADR